MKNKLTILGAGSWGTTLAVVLSAKKELDITLWSAFKEHALSLQKYRQNKDFLPSVKIPSSIEITADLRTALNSKIIVLAIPVEYLRSVLKRVKKYKSGRKIFVSVSKGIEIKTLKRPSQIVREELGRVSFAVLSGPTIARELARGVPTTAVICSKNKRTAVYLQEIFSLGIFRIYRNNDIAGVELGGALKNIIAIACGISDGLGFGTNTKSALICRGLKEMVRFAKHFGAKEKTLFGISGLGDLATTCFSDLSRNHFVGVQIARGKKLKAVLSGMKMVAEGITTVKSVYSLSTKLNIYMPITQQVYSVLYKNKSPLQAVKDLMQREKKPE